MANELLEQLQAIDPAVLTEVVRKAQNDATFEIKQWSVKNLSSKGMMNPDGLWLFSGTGNGNW